MQPFDELRAEAEVLARMAQLRRANPSAARCLDKAFAEIKDGNLRLHFLGTEPGLHYTSACGYLLLVTDLGETGVIVGLTESPGDEPLL